MKQSNHETISNMSVKKKVMLVKELPATIRLFDWEDKNSISFKLREIIFTAAKEVLGKNASGLAFHDIKLEHPQNSNFGDYSTNIAMTASKMAKMNPRDFAQKIVSKLNDYIISEQTISSKAVGKVDEIDITALNEKNQSKAVPQTGPGNEQVVNSTILGKAEMAGGGFVNLWLRSDYLISELVELLKSESGVITTQMIGKNIAVEYTDPNPFKEFHIGHLYSNVIGESMACLFEACGAKVWRGDFYGDVGMHVAKSVWGMMNKIRNSKFEIRNLEKLPISQRQKFLGEGYALGVVKFEENSRIQEEVKDINCLIYIAGQEILKKTRNWKPIIDYRKYVKVDERKLAEVSQVYEAGLRWSLEYFETIYKELGTRFDGYYPESWVGELGMKIVEKGLEMGVLEKSDGAIVFKGEKEGLHTRVFVNKLGLPTYEAKDLGLAQAKYRDFPYDLSINVFGKEIDEYYQVVRTVLRKIEPDLGKKAEFIPHGMVKLPEGKMASRKGNVITYEMLMEEVKKRVVQIIEKSATKSEGDQDTSDGGPKGFIPRIHPEGLLRGGGNKETMGNTIEKVGLGAIKYALLKSNIGNDVTFDFDKSISLEGDSGPYLMYTYARGRSVLRKAQNTGGKDTSEETVRTFNPEELAILRTLYKFPEVVAEATKTFSPNLVCSYLFDLAQKFNLFYNKHTILHSEFSIQNSEANKPITDNLPASPAGGQLTTNFRLTLTEATSIIIRQGLHILGIETVERM